MKIEVTDNQMFSDWTKDVLISMSTVDYLQMHLSDTIALMRMLGAYTDPMKRMYYAYTIKTIRDVSTFLENVMKNLKVPKTYFGLKDIGNNGFFAEVKVIGAASVPILSGAGETFKLVWYDLDEGEARHAKVQKAVDLDDLKDDFSELDALIRK